jgi:uncharacterized protein (DUF1778 family)
MARAVLSLNCSTVEARRIRQQAQHDRRSISGYVLHVVMRTVGIEEASYAKARMIGPLKRAAVVRPRTKLLVRCTMEEAHRIRTAAARRKSTISAYMLHSLRNSWEALRKYSSLYPRTAPRIPE